MTEIITTRVGLEGWLITHPIRPWLWSAHVLQAAGGWAGLLSGGRVAVTSALPACGPPGPLSSAGLHPQASRLSQLRSVDGIWEAVDTRFINGHGRCCLGTNQIPLYFFLACAMIRRACFLLVSDPVHWSGGRSWLLGAGTEWVLCVRAFRTCPPAGHREGAPARGLAQEGLTLFGEH